MRNREEAANVRTFFELRFAENCVRARPACVSARFGLLKACESPLKKRSACTMRGAPLLKFAEVLRVALAGSEFLPFYKIRDLTVRASGAVFQEAGAGGVGEGPGAAVDCESLAGEWCSVLLDGWPLEARYKSYGRQQQNGHGEGDKDTVHCGLSLRGWTRVRPYGGCIHATGVEAPTTNGS